jgi:hypothetical protein
VLRAASGCKSTFLICPIEKHFCENTRSGVGKVGLFPENWRGGAVTVCDAKHNQSFHPEHCVFLLCSIQKHFCENI